MDVRNDRGVIIVYGVYILDFQVCGVIYIGIILFEIAEEVPSTIMFVICFHPIHEPHRVTLHGDAICCNTTAVAGGYLLNFFGL